MSGEMFDEAAHASAQQATADAKRNADIAALIKLKDATITRMVRNRVYVKHVGETLERPESLCAGCGGSFVARGYCTNCGAPR